MSDEVYDNLLYQVLNHCDCSYEKFLDLIFSFLYRRTFFFKRGRNGDGKPGLLAEEMVKIACKKYLQLVAERQSDVIYEPVHMQECGEESVQTTELESANVNSVPMKEAVDLVCLSRNHEVYKVEDMLLTENDIKKDTADLRICNDSDQGCYNCAYYDNFKVPQMCDFQEQFKIWKKYIRLETERQGDIISEPVYVQECIEEIVETTELDPPRKISTSITELANLVDEPLHYEICKTEDTPVKGNDSEKVIDDLGAYYDSNPECYNGASYDNYSWSQTIYDLDVQIKVPNFITNGKQVKVHISHTHLKAEVLDSNEWEVVLRGQLSQKVNTEGSVWTLDLGHHIHVHLEKAQQQFWEALLVGEPKINVQDIDCSKPYEDLPEEEQAKIQEVLYDHHQKSLGKPTVKESKVHEILKEAWNKDDSPFKGQKFDPSNFSVME